MPKLIIFFSLIIFSIDCFAQVESTPSPLGPARAPLQTELGLVFGVGPSWQTGKLFASCNCPDFEKGNGSVIFLGVDFRKDLFNPIQWGTLLGLTLIGNNASFQQRELLTFRASNNEIFKDVPVLFRQKAKLSFSQINLIPYFSIMPWDFLYFRIGLNLDFRLNSSIKHTKELLQRTVRLENGELIELSLENSDQVTIEEGTLPQTSFLLYSLYSGLGFSFRLGINIFGDVSFCYNLPFNNVSNRGDNFKLNYWILMFNIKYALKLRHSN